ncbi:S-formylglutathione hydrolase [Caballeronia sp. GACF4]|uniref:S-formylglutathione hydrolase n=1 Tax=Caballeronia sp. GACF4 TaxID=2921763 RepID=UPI0020290BAA|nr:S-formylglutathione hydrolase [Caballeronia sp. GACF4]
MLELVEEHRCFDGVQHIYRHQSDVIGLPMRFSVFLPAQAAHSRVPALFYLAGLTCTEETFPIKGGAQRYAAEHGIALISPDTSPRGAGIPGESDAWDFGVGAGFYVDATVAPWAERYRMYSYVTQELRELVLRELPLREDRIGIFGHSMGGHGALVLALRNPDLYRSVSAFAPIAAPSLCPWGVKAFSGYLGDNREAWKLYDASELVIGDAASRFDGGILIDQGLADQFLDGQLFPDVFERNAREAGHRGVVLRKHDGYDHGYFFISTFVGEHVAHHARALCK